MITWRAAGRILVIGAISTWQATPAASPGAQLQAYSPLGGVRTWQATPAAPTVSSGAQLQSIAPLGGMRTWQATPSAPAVSSGAQVVQLPPLGGMRIWQATPQAEEIVGAQIIQHPPLGGMRFWQATPAPDVVEPEPEPPIILPGAGGTYVKTKSRGPGADYYFIRHADTIDKKDLMEIISLIQLYWNI